MELKKFIDKCACHFLKLWEHILLILYPSFSVCLKTTDALIPSKKTKTSAGYDLHSNIEVTIPPWKKVVCETNVVIDMRCNKQVYGRIAPRSGLAAKNGIHVGAGVIDSDYQGSIGVVLFNLSDEEFKVNKGDRIAQLIFEKIMHPELKYASSNCNDESERSINGFGSTGNS